MHSVFSSPHAPAQPVRHALRAALVGLAVLSGTVARADSFLTVHSLGAADGTQPFGSLLAGPGGLFYGTTTSGGNLLFGTAFAVDENGQFTVLHDFNTADEGGEPLGELLWGQDGALYGVASAFGTGHCGSVFRLSTAGQFSVLHHFAAAEGCEPTGALAQGPDGALYGSTVLGGLHNAGTVFRIASDGSTSVLHHFAGGTADGAAPRAGVTRTPQGDLFGVTTQGGSLNGGVAWRYTAQGAYQVLAEFGSTAAAGTAPYAPLTLASDGRLYGATLAGGALGGGTLFRMSSTGKLKVLHALDQSAFDTGGHRPYARLLQGADGALYGTTSAGSDIGLGTVFRMTLAGKYTVLHRFAGGAESGAPMGGLAQAPDGRLLSTTAATVFRTPPK